MAVSEAKKRANAKWDSENMATLACKVKRTQAVAFKSYCEGRGKTANTALKEYVMSCIGEGESPQKDVEGPTAPVAGILSPDTLKAAQEASKRTGEDVGQFVVRSVDEQTKRDEVSFRMGIHPLK